MDISDSIEVYDESTFQEGEKLRLPDGTWAAVHAVDPIRTMEIVKDGNIAWSAGAEGLDAAVTWTDPEPLRGEHYYYLRVVQADGQMAWSGPIWLRRAAEE